MRDSGAYGFRRPWQADVLTVLAVARREVDAIEVATGVLPIQNQHPMLLAQRALTLSLISSGRFILGLGMTHRMVTEGMWGCQLLRRGWSVVVGGVL
jgi:alkanesulfonate monooxygenase SsuD/methylene tetrahydromethanopterin reductase-like flavin-dependent oxidoreductase (luciferase family)